MPSRALATSFFLFGSFSFWRDKKEKEHIKNPIWGPIYFIDKTAAIPYHYTMFSKLTTRTKRLYVQIAAAVFTFSYFLAPILKYIPCPTLTCYACPLSVFACPIGTLQHFVIIGVFPFFLLGILFLVGALVGRWTCGYLCPFGLFQDLLAKIRRKKFDPPSWLGWGRYVSLFGVAIIIPALTHEPWFSKLCPVGTIEAGIPYVAAALLKIKLPGQPFDALGMVGNLFWLKIFLLALTIAAAIYIKRPFCRYHLPAGGHLRNVQPGLPAADKSGSVRNLRKGRLQKAVPGGHGHHQESGLGRLHPLPAMHQMPRSKTGKTHQIIKERI